jgi:hypothetical protein
VAPKAADLRRVMRLTRASNLSVSPRSIRAAPNNVDPKCLSSSGLDVRNTGNRCRGSAPASVIMSARGSVNAPCARSAPPLIRHLPQINSNPGADAELIYVNSCGLNAHPGGKKMFHHPDGTGPIAQFNVECSGKFALQRTAAEDQRHFVVPLPADSARLFPKAVTRPKRPGGQACTRAVSFSAPWTRWLTAAEAVVAQMNRLGTTRAFLMVSGTLNRETRSRRSERRSARVAWAPLMRCGRIRRGRG